MPGAGKASHGEKRTGGYDKNKSGRRAMAALQGEKSGLRKICADVMKYGHKENENRISPPTGQPEKTL